jgi:hypothetical protein
LSEAAIIYNLRLSSSELAGTPAAAQQPFRLVGKLCVDFHRHRGPFAAFRLQSVGGRVCPWLQQNIVAINFHCAGSNTFNQ